MKKSLLLSLTLFFFVVAAFGMNAVSQADQRRSGEPANVLWYVKRNAIHVGSGHSFGQEYGPYSTKSEALAKKAELDANRAFGTFAYGVAEVYSKPSPYALKLRPSSTIIRP